MLYAIDRARRGAAVVGLVSALILLPLAPAHARNLGAVPEITLAQAATGPSRTAPAPAARSGSPQPGPSAQQPGNRDQDVQQQVADLKKQLKIAGNQEQQFEAFAQVLRSNAQAMDALMQQQSQNPPKNAVDDLKTAQQMAEAEADGLKKLVPAFQALYDSLSDQQKKTADSIFGGAPEGGAQPAPAPRRKG